MKSASVVPSEPSHGVVKAKHSGSTDGGDLGHSGELEVKSVLEMNLRKLISHVCKRRAMTKGN